MATCNGILPSDIFLLLTEKTRKITPLLDDTLLNRLEVSLYCNDVCHRPFWDKIHSIYYTHILDLFEETFDDLELYCGTLKLKFAILWHFKCEFNLAVYEKFGNILISLINADDIMLCSLKTFFDVASRSRDALRIFSTIDSELVLPQLKKKWDQSPNIIYKSAIMTIFMDIFFSTLFSPICSSERVRKLGTLFSIESITYPFYYSFFTNFNTYSLRLDYSVEEHPFTEKFSQIAEFFLINLPSLQNNELDDAIYVLFLLSPSLSAGTVQRICFAIDESRQNLSPARILRQILMNHVFREYIVSECLIKTWYELSWSALGVHDIEKFRKIITPLTTCRIDFMQFGLFQTLIPQNYITLLWNEAVLDLENTITVFDSGKISPIIWLFLNKLINFQLEVDGLLRLKKMLHYFEKFAGDLVLFPFLIDCAFLLYTKIENVSNAELLLILDRIFHLVTRECISITTSSGNLFYSFLLLRIFDYNLLNCKDPQYLAPFCLKLIELQDIVSCQAQSNSDTLSNETILSIQKGFFVAKLLKCESFLHGNGDILRKLLNLSCLTPDKCESISGSLKGIILSCLLSCLPTPDESLSMNLISETCAELLNVGIEEDPSVRTAVVSSWLRLMERSQKSQNEQLDYFVRKFANDSKSYNFLHDQDPSSDGEICPTCNESLSSLLGDIIINKMSAGDTDCIGD